MTMISTSFRRLEDDPVTCAPNSESPKDSARCEPDRRRSQSGSARDSDHQNDGDPDGFFEAFQEDGRKKRNQGESETDVHGRVIEALQRVVESGFSTMCAVASAADSVIVMMKSVATNPSRIKIKNLPFHHESKFRQHRDRAFAMWTLTRDAPVNRQRTQQG